MARGSSHHLLWCQMTIKGDWDFRMRKKGGPQELVNNNAEVGPKFRTPTYLVGQMRFVLFFLLNTTYSP